MGSMTPAVLLSTCPASHGAPRFQRRALRCWGSYQKATPRQLTLLTSSPFRRLPSLSRAPHRALGKCDNRLSPTAPKVRRHVCRAASSRSLIPSHGYDYYELLGVDPTCSADEIKGAYRRLQKRCHPDVAGREDMAVLLNEAYSTLSDPNLRFTYDQLRVTWLKDDAFSGQPVYSTWHGPAEESTAVFVDEVSCVGCLQCSLLAPNTFAIELKHGRARALRQWGDGEEAISAAMLSCPVSCIKWVERSKLPALEHIMSTLPRHSLYSVQTSNVNVYAEAEKFLDKRKQNEKEIETTKAKREQARSAVDAIRGWWGSGKGKGSAPGAKAGPHTLARASSWKLQWEIEQAQSSREALAGEVVPEELRALHGAAQKSAGKGSGPAFFSSRSGGPEEEEEYWNPTSPVIAAAAPRATDNTHTTQPSSASRGGVPYSASATGPETSGPKTRASSTSSISGNSDDRGPHGSATEQAWSFGARLFDDRLGRFEQPQGTPTATQEWPANKTRQETSTVRTSRVLQAVSLLPLLVSMGAGAWAWLASDGAGMESQALAMQAASSTGIALLPPSVVSSAGLRVALCMAVWYAVGAVLASATYLCLSLASDEQGTQDLNT